MDGSSVTSIFWITVCYVHAVVSMKSSRNPVKTGSSHGSQSIIESQVIAATGGCTYRMVESNWSKHVLYGRRSTDEKQAHQDAEGKSVQVNATVVNSTLKKKSQSLFFFSVREDLTQFSSYVGPIYA